MSHHYVVIVYAFRIALAYNCNAQRWRQLEDGHPGELQCVRVQRDNVGLMHAYARLSVGSVYQRWAVGPTAYRTNHSFGGNLYKY